MKLELLTNPTVVDDAIRFVSERSNDKAKLESSSSSKSNEENDKMNQEQEHETGEITINQVF
jgi:hypothetical protein